MLESLPSTVSNVGFYSSAPCGFKLDGGRTPSSKSSVVSKTPALKIMSVGDVHTDFHEPGILTGYRYPNSSFKMCLISLFRLHNETINIWTQIVPAIYFLIQFVSLLPTFDPFLLIYLATTFLFLMTSACAHTFSCLSPVARHVCFFFDYAGITLYSCGCAVVYYAYTLPMELIKPSLFVGADFCDVYLFLSIFFAIWSTHLSGITRFWKPSFIRKAVRLCAFVVIWLYLAVPVLWRLVRCSSDPNPQPGECSSVYYWKLQFISAVTAGLLYVSHFPERWFPGKFDILGHSHQIFHLFGASGAFNQYRALWIDHIERKQNNHSPSVSLSVLCIVVVVFANLIIFCTFYKRVRGVHRSKVH